MGKIELVSLEKIKNDLGEARYKLAKKALEEGEQIFFFWSVENLELCDILTDGEKTAAIREIAKQSGKILITRKLSVTIPEPTTETKKKENSKPILQLVWRSGTLFPLNKYGHGSFGNPLAVNFIYYHP
ncbi:hypothetical protein KKF29_01050 [Patescibacteria group bacterium]|nr:hypothetical protein [Patescibacteria group bacterium]